MDENHNPRRGKYFEPVQEEPEGMEDLDDQALHASPPYERNNTMTDAARCQCANFLLMNSG